MECCSKLFSVLIISPTLAVWLNPEVKWILLNYKNVDMVSTHNNKFQLKEQLGGNTLREVASNFSQKHVRKEEQFFMNSSSDSVGIFQCHLPSPLSFRYIRWFSLSGTSIPKVFDIPFLLLGMSPSQPILWEGSSILKTQWCHLSCEAFSHTPKAKIPSSSFLVTQHTVNMLWLLYYTFQGREEEEG